MTSILICYLLFQFLSTFPLLPIEILPFYQQSIFAVVLAESLNVFPSTVYNIFFAEYHCATILTVVHPNFKIY